MAVPIDLGSAANKYATVTPASAGTWQNRAQAAAQVWEANAKSPQTEQYWAQRVMEAAQSQARLRGLQNVSAADYAQGVANSAQIFSQKTAAASGKWQNKFAPYAQIINTIVPSLPAKTTDVATNVQNRVVPIAVALRQAKLGGAISGVGSPTMTPLSPPTPTFGTPFGRR